MLGVLTGCGETTKQAAVTSTPTRTAVPTATATPPPAGGRQAQERLAKILSDDALDRGRICRPSGDLPTPAIAASDCDYDGDSKGAYLLYKSRADMQKSFTKLRRGGKKISGTACSGASWRRGTNATRSKGRLAFVRLDGGTLLLWGDDSRRLLGVLRATSAPVREVCSIWKTRG
jgi:hypothetical protein